jgi:hypothetical protein
MAHWYGVDMGGGDDRLLPRLAENETILVETFTLITAALEMNRRIAPAGEWLLDNFYLIEEQVRTARRHLPLGYSRRLPRLENGPLAIGRADCGSQHRRHPRLAVPSPHEQVLCGPPAKGGEIQGR